MGGSSGGMGSAVAGPGGGGAGNTGPGLLSTTTGLLFTGDPTGNFLAFNAADGKILCHFPLHTSVGNGPMTFTLDGKQYVAVLTREIQGNRLFEFALDGAAPWPSDPTIEAPQAGP